MSAAAGHIKHLYEELYFTRADIIHIISDLINGNINAYEKFDGINIMVTVKNGKVLYARNTSQLKNPVDKSIIIDMFAKYEHVKLAFIEASNALESSLTNIDTSYIEQFFKSGSIFLNAEIINIKSQNVIKYDQYGLYLNNIFDIITNKFNVNYAEKIYHDNEPIFKKYSIFPPKRVIFNMNSDIFNNINMEIMNIYMLLSLNRIQAYYDSLNWDKKKIPNRSSLKTYITNIGASLINSISTKSSYSNILDFLKPSLSKINKDTDLQMKMAPHIEYLSNKYEMQMPSIEGIVFYYGDALYKITGLFGAINQIHGCIKYKR
jgi:hypothetical protein